LLSSSGLPGTHHHPAFVSQVIGLQTCPIIPSFLHVHHKCLCHCSPTALSWLISPSLTSTSPLPQCWWRRRCDNWVMLFLKHKYKYKDDPLLPKCSSGYQGKRPGLTYPQDLLWTFKCCQSHLPECSASR
jgi:hypothetical protein